MELTIRDLIWAGALLVSVAGSHFRTRAKVDKTHDAVTEIITTKFPKLEQRLNNTRKVLFNENGKMLVCTMEVCKEKREELKDSLHSNQHKTDQLVEEVRTLREIMILIAHELKIDVNNKVIHNRRSSDN